MKIVPMEQLGREKWDAFVVASDQAWFHHLYDLILAKSFWPHHINDSFAIMDDTDQICAIMPIHRICTVRKKILPWHVMNSLGGMAVHNDAVGTKREDKIWQAVFSHVVGQGGYRHVQCFEMWLSPMSPAFQGKNCPLVNPLVPRGMCNTLTQTWVVDLMQDEDDLRSATAENFRRALRKAQSIDTLSIREAQCHLDDLDKYYRLHELTYARSSLSPHPRAYFEHIWERIFSQGNCRILFAEERGEVIAAINYARTKNACMYWTGASSQRAYDLYANHLLHWTMLMRLKAAGCEWAEIGEAIFRSENEKHKSISDFKSRMGGRLYPYYKGMLSRKELSLYAGG